ncbi:DUF1232 domain-containing protein [Salmonella enterica subsp. enterica serovar Virchow]|nr:DUF1232 domain-containing protein [Salmonella enterica subsp. enterica serovar Virchow]
MACARWSSASRPRRRPRCNSTPDTPPVPGWLDTAKGWARRIKTDVIALWIAARDPRTPLIAKIVAGVVAAYALSPIDLIPDFIPVLGYLDDLLIVPLGILVAVSLIPPDLMIQFRDAAGRLANRPASRAGLVAIIATWISGAALAGWLVWRAA